MKSKPITDTEAESVLEEMDSIEHEYERYQWVLPPSPPLAFKWIRRLLADRKVAMEIIEELSEMFVKSHADFEVIVKARALIAAVKVGRGLWAMKGEKI